MRRLIVGVGFLCSIGCGSDDKDLQAGPPSGEGSGGTSEGTQGRVSATTWSGTTQQEGDGTTGDRVDTTGSWDSGDETGLVFMIQPDTGRVEPFEPTAESISFEAGEALPPGSWLVFNNWSAAPNELLAVSADDLAGPAQLVLRANRVWSVGVNLEGNRFAFSAADPLARNGYGATFEDSIMPTFLYEVGMPLRTLAWGNINDECHAFSPSGDELYVCRRYDWTEKGTYLGYRIGAIEVDTGAFEFLREEQTENFEIVVAPIPGSNAVLFGTTVRPPGSGSAIHRLDLTTGAETLVLNNASRPAVDPTGAFVVFQNHADARAFYVAEVRDIAGTMTRVAGMVGTRAVWSPAGDAFAFLEHAAAPNCQHVRLASLGEEGWGSVRVRDCTATGEFITTTAWVNVSSSVP